jgi:hypothetical protein
MTETIEVKVKVTLLKKVDGESDVVREVVQAVIDGVNHPEIKEVELVDFCAGDFKSPFKPQKTPSASFELF